MTSDTESASVEQGVPLMSMRKEKIGVNNPNPAYAIDATGDINASENLRINGNAIADFIVEQGTSGNWTWRKWSSGLQELFYRGGYKSFSKLSASGSIYYADVLQDIVYPVTFLAVPIVTSAFQTGMQGSSQLSNVWAWTSGHTETGFKHMYLARGTNVAVGGIPTFVAVGRWK